MKSRNLYLVRHGKIDTQGQKSYIGQIDLPLSDSGRRQAAKLRDEFSDIEFAGVFCSDLERSFATAQIICEKQRVEPIAKKDLREISLGLWEGLSFDEVRKKYPDQFKFRGEDIFNYRPPKGESFALCADRVLPAVAEIAGGATGDILIVGHAGVNRIILSHVLNISQEYFFKIIQEYGGLNVLRLEDVEARIVRPMVSGSGKVLGLGEKNSRSLCLCK